MPAGPAGDGGAAVGGAAWRGRRDARGARPGGRRAHMRRPRSSPGRLPSSRPLPAELARAAAPRSWRRGGGSGPPPPRRARRSLVLRSRHGFLGLGDERPRAQRWHTSRQAASACASTGSRAWSAANRLRSTPLLSKQRIAWLQPPKGPRARAPRRKGQLPFPLPRRLCPQITTSTEKLPLDSKSAGFP
ncbi:hypothetical protein PAHAL_6G072700 [Panicum hallii]|uniref:Uncharacterized protein n=1 Tax=Panicum hallii TaxID=206008 RepID=A0A2S3I142_9POAL|nr:hypothetical protein PAHAL_6G072700 [Panicum hallii]